MKNNKIMLIADDVDVNREMLSGLFQSEYAILQAADGLEAIKIIAQHCNEISIILLDIVMPNMDGIAVLKWLKEKNYTNIPVVAVSAEPKYQLEALQNGALDFIAQPTDNEIIKARVKNIVSRYAFPYEMKRNQSLVRENREQANIMNSIPGGIATYKIIDNRFETLYFSDGVPELSGHTREEYERAIGNDAAQLIYSEDKSRIWHSAMEMLKSGQPIDETYRICHKNGTFVWIRINGVIVGEQGGAPILHAVFQKPSRMAKLYDNLVNESKDIIYVCDTNNYDLLYVNKAGLAATKKEKEDYSHEKCHEFLFGFSSPCPFCRMAQMRYDCFLERDFTYPLNNRTYSMRGKLTDWNGLQAHVEYVSDVTEIRKAEAQKKAWTDNLQLIMDHIPGGMCVYKADKAGIHPIVHNQAFFDIFGYSPAHQQDVLGSTNFLNVHPDDLEGLKRVITQAIKTDKKVNHTYRCFNDKKGRYLWINLNAVVLPQSNEEKLCYVSYTDVTKERDAQDKLVEAGQRMEKLKVQAQEALESYQSLVNAVPGGIAQFEIVGSQLCTGFFSDGLCTLTERSREELSAMSNEAMIAVTYAPDLPLLKECIKQAIAANQNIDITYRIKNKSGNPKWVHLSAAYLPGANGEKYYQAVFTDIDGLKKAEQELRENQLRYSVAIQSSRINVWEYDIQKDSLYIVSNSSRIKQNCYYIDNAWLKIKDGNTYKFSFSIQEKDGSIRRKQIQFTYIASPRKTYLMSRIDVNDIYEAQEKAKQKLEKALAAKSEFLSNMSHDMRTPMNGILGLLHLTLDMPGIPAEVYDNLRGMQDSSKYLLGLINDTLDMSKIESNRLTLEYEAVNTAEFIKDVMTYVGPLAEENGVTLNVLTKNAELEYIKASPLRLRQIFVNIVTNAIKFTPKGGRVDMVIECYKRENGIAYDRISIKDNGIGMSKEFLPKIFEPFEQENALLGGASQGTGLGMPIVKRLVEMMGGKIEVFSEKNVGTEVVVWLNFQRFYSDKLQIEAQNTHRSGTLAGKTILLAEDHPLNATIAKKLLEKKGIVVEVAANGKLAVDLFRNSAEKHFDAILMDIRMPIMDGLEAAKEIRALNREDAKNIPIIAMTANAFDDDRKMSLQAGMNAHLAKPIEPEKLYDTLSDFLCMETAKGGCE